MAKEATQANRDANSDYSQWERTSNGDYGKAMGNYNSQIAKMDAMGNPYKSKDYLTNQNILTSGAMHATNQNAEAALRGAELRGGTNDAATAATISSNARAAQMQADQMQAQRASGDQDKYLQWEQGLAQDKLAGASAATQMFGQQVSGRSNALSNLQSGQNASQQMWGNVIGGVAGGAGSLFGGPAAAAGKV